MSTLPITTVCYHSRIAALQQELQGILDQLPKDPCSSSDLQVLEGASAADLRRHLGDARGDQSMTGRSLCSQWICGRCAAVSVVLLRGSSELSSK